MGTLGKEKTQAAAMLVFGKVSLEVGGGLVRGLGELAAPFHEEAVAQPTHHPHQQHRVLSADPTTVVVVGNIQTLVQTVLDAPGLAVEEQPAPGVQPFGLDAGDEADVLRTVTFDLTQHPGGLRREGEAEGLGADRRGT